MEGIEKKALEICEPDPALFSPEEAASWLRKSGISDEHWHETAYFGIFGDLHRALAHIALTGETMDLYEVCEKQSYYDDDSPILSNTVNAILKSIKKSHEK